MGEDDEKLTEDESEADESLLEDVTVTAEFDYDEGLENLARQGDEETAAKEEPQVPESAVNPKVNQKAGRTKQDESNAGSGNSASKSEGADSKASEQKEQSDPPADDSITRALDDFDALLDEEMDSADEGDSESGSGESGPGPNPGESGANLAGDPGESGMNLAGMPEPDSGSIPGPKLESNNQSNPGFGYDEPQVSGVFSRYDEETSDEDDEDFDLFEESEVEETHERTLQEIVNAHEKEVRRLRRQVDYQKQVLQIMSELLVEARVISRKELKKRLKKLRRENS